MQLAAGAEQRARRLRVRHARGRRARRPAGNDTAGLCLQACHAECVDNCSASLFTEVPIEAYPYGQVSSLCVPPTAPSAACVPPPGCTRECSDTCFDASHLINRYGDACRIFDLNNTNITVVSLPYAYNVSQPPECSRNMSTWGMNGTHCAAEYTYYNVTQYATDYAFYDWCIRDCFAACTTDCLRSTASRGSRCPSTRRPCACRAASSAS